MENKVIPVIAIVLVLLFGIFMISYTSGDITGYGIFDKLLKFKDKPSEVVVSEPDSEEVVANEDISERDSQGGVIPFRDTVQETINEGIIRGDLVCDSLKITRNKLYPYRGIRIYYISTFFEDSRNHFYGRFNIDGITYNLEEGREEHYVINNNLTVRYTNLTGRGESTKAILDICSPRPDILSTCIFKKFPEDESLYPIDGDSVCDLNKNRKICLFGYVERGLTVGSSQGGSIDSTYLQNFNCNIEFEYDTEARQVLCCDFSDI